MTLIALEPGTPGIGRVLLAASAKAAAIGKAKALRWARRRRLEVSLVGGLTGALALGALIFSGDAPPEQEAARPAAPPAWVEVQHPLRMFAFEAPEFAKATSAFSMRRHSTGGGREDILTFGAFAEKGPWLRLVVHQVGAEGAPGQTMFVETARRAADAGLALDGVGRSLSLPTRFGPVEWAEARLAAPGQFGPREGCAAFRFGADDPVMRVSGLVCGPDGDGFTRRQMACLVGRLDLAAASEDPKLQRFFAGAELARDPACAISKAKTPVAAQPAPAKQAPAKPVLRASAQR